MKTKKVKHPAQMFQLKKIPAQWILLPTLASTAVFAHTASASTADISGGKSSIEEITVTAAKREQSLLDFSGSISVVETGKPHLTLSDIAREVPGFFVVDAGPRNPAGLVMRGLRVDEVGANDLGGDGYAVATYVDNVPLQGYFVPPAFSLKDLQQVEVLRGPQGTLYGNASIGGLIRYVTAKPDLTKTSVSITTAVSQTDNSSGINYDTDLVVNAPIINDTLGVRLLLGKEHNKGFIDNPYLLTGSRQDINDDELAVARLSVLWQPTEEFSLAGSQHVQKTKVGDRQATNSAFTGDDYTTSSNYLQPVNGELRLSSVDATYQFPWANLTASINRYDYTTDQRSDQTDYLLTLDEQGGWGFYSADENFSAYNHSNVDVVKDSVEFRLVSKDDQRLRWLVGAFSSTDELAVTIADIAPGFAAFLGLDRTDDLDYYATQDEDLSEHSFYAELAYDVTPAWEVLIGARSFRYDDEIAICTGLPISYGLEGDELGLDCYNSRDKHNDVLGKFSIKYKIHDNQSLYFTVAEGFRRGGANALPAEIDHSRSYQPDTAINYELGSHSYFFEQQLRLSAALFYIDWQDIQVSTVIADYYGGTVNAKAARSQGLELEALAKLSHGWSLRSGFAFTDAELREDVASINGGEENVYAGDTLPGSPRYQWNLGLDYTRALNSATLDVGASISRMSEIYTALNEEFANYDRLSGFTLANAQASISWRNWRAGAFINNIANTRAITGKRTSGLYGDRGQFEYVTRPRTVGVSVNYTY